MKVLLVSFEYPPKTEGGIGTYAEQLVHGLHDRGIDVYTITRGDKAYCDERIYRVLAPDTLYWRRFYFTRDAISLMYRLNRLHRFDVVHLNGTYAIMRRLRLPTVSTFHAPPNALQLAMALKLLRSPRSVNDVTYLVLKNPMGCLFDVLSSKASDKIICPSPILARDLRSYVFVDEQKIHVVPNGVDLKRFDETECFCDSFLDRYSIQRGNFLLYIGRLSFLKGVQHLIEAYKIARKKHRTLKLVIAGSGYYELHLRNLAHNVKGIIFLGYVSSDEVKKLLYEASLAFVNPSLIYEVAPMSILEAMAYGKPVIATNVGGTSFMIKHGKNGFLSQPKDPEDIATYVNTLYEDKTLERKMGAHGRKLVEREFSLDRMISRTLRVYDSTPCCAS